MTAAAYPSLRRLQHRRAAAQRAWIVTASGSTLVGSALDFNTPYLRTVLGFIGIPDVLPLRLRTSRSRLS